MSTIELPIFGKGSQPEEEDGAQLAFMAMPEAMSTFQMPPVSVEADLQSLQPARDLLERLRLELKHRPVSQSAAVLPLGGMDEGNRRFIDELMGEGEVSIRYDGSRRFRIQESVLAGVWRVQRLSETGEAEEEWLEVGEVPRLVRERSFVGAAERIDTAFPVAPAGVMNAPPLLSELNAAIGRFCETGHAHMINLSLLPQTEQDLAFLAQHLGAGSTTILSRGYGNCRISSTAVRFVWWVQYFNSEDTMILNTLEVAAVPEVACAAAEDMEDSYTRLEAMLNAYL